MRFFCLEVSYPFGEVGKKSIVMLVRVIHPIYILFHPLLRAFNLPLLLFIVGRDRVSYQEFFTEILKFLRSFNLRSPGHERPLCLLK